MTDTPVLPHSLDAERSVLGAILLHNDLLADVADSLAPADFFRLAHRKLFSVMVTLADRNEAIDLLTLTEALKRSGDLEEVGGPAYISKLTDGLPRSTNIRHYARIVRDHARRRTLIAGANVILQKAYAADQEATAVIEEAERTLLALSEQTGRRFDIESMREVAPRVLDLLERAYNTKNAVSGVPTGFIELDDLTHGLQPGTLVILGARPGMGKSSFGMNVAQYAAEQGLSAAIFSLEMPKEDLMLRQVAATARLDSHRLRSGFIADRDWARISQAVGHLAELRIAMDETPAANIFHVRTRARRIKVERGLDLLIIDYLQLMGSHERRDTRTLELGAITAAMKALAKELKIPVLVLSQLSRDQEKRGNRPKLSDLRDSGSIEQDADVVLFLYRAESATAEDGTDLIIAKHRNGPIGTVKLAWFEEQTRFANFQQADEYTDRRLPMGDR